MTTHIFKPHPELVWVNTTDRDFRLEFPNVSFPKPLKKEHLAEYGWVLAEEAVRPPPILGKVLQLKAMPEQTAEGKWIRDWELLDAPYPTSDEVTRERDQRQLLDFEWNGYWFQGDKDSTEKIMGLVTAAHLFLTLSQGSPTDTKWMDGVNDFKFTDRDDNEHILTAPDMIQLGLAKAARVNYLHNKAKQIKAMNTIPYDFRTDEDLWTDV